MISRISGAVVYTSERFMIVDVGGMGYKIFSTASTIGKLGKLQEKVVLWTHLVVREDALDLFGFQTRDELDFFEMLISISGIGPKTALGILNVAKIEDLEQAITTGDTTHLTKVSGVGKKIADKIVLELRGKISTQGDKDGKRLKDEIDTLEALKALGYSHSESREALEKIPKSIVGTSEKIKHALKNLGSEGRS